MPALSMLLKVVFIEGEVVGEVSWRKTASARGERQMFPRQTKRMRGFVEGVVEVLAPDDPSRDMANS